MDVSSFRGPMDFAFPVLKRPRKGTSKNALSAALSGYGATQSLLTIPAPHASEILEAVAEKVAELRDPSNYATWSVLDRDSRQGRFLHSPSQKRKGHGIPKGRYGCGCQKPFWDPILVGR